MAEEIRMMIQLKKFRIFEMMKIFELFIFYHWWLVMLIKMLNSAICVLLVDVVDGCCALKESEMVLEYFAELRVPIVRCVVRSREPKNTLKISCLIQDLS